VVVHQSGRPLHLQIADALRGDIRGGRYPPGAKLPSERELRDTWEVAQNTIRAALAQLRDEGLVVGYQGRGWFVREQTVRRKVGADRSWRDILARGGKQDASRFTIRREPCPPEVADRLGVDAGEVVTVRDRLLRAEGEPPSFISISWHPVWIVQLIPDLADPTEHRGMKGMHEDAGLRLHYNDVFASRRPTEEERRELELEPGDTVTVQTGVTYDQDRRPLYAILHVGGGHRIEFAVAYGEIPPTD
jgi:GntR family transcriptional regulator